MVNDSPFPTQAKTLKIAVTSTASVSGALPAIGNSLRVVNEGTATAFIDVGTGSRVATVPATSSPVATCTPILAGQDVVFTIVKPEAVADGLGSFTAPTVLNISAITAGGTTTLYVSVGEGQ
jgi:hypothetical protein